MAPAAIAVEARAFPVVGRPSGPPPLPSSGPPPLPSSSGPPPLPSGPPPLPSGPPPLPSDAAALFESRVAAPSTNGAAYPDAEPAPATGSAPGGFRPTVAVAPLSERYGDEAPPSDALPSFGGATMAADELLASGELEAASQEYEAALALLDDEDDRARSLSRLARALSGLGRKADAEARYDEALALAPHHVEVLHARAELDDSAGDMDALLLSAEAWLGRVREHPRAMELLAKAADATGDARRGIDARRKQARHNLSGPERAQAFLDSSLLAEIAVGDDALATALALEGLELSPSHLGLLDRARALFERENRAHELLAYYERAMSQILDPDTALSVAERIEQLASNPEADPRVAVAALERLIETRPADVALRHRVADLYTGLGDAPRALAQCRLAARVAPMNSENYRRSYALFQQLHDTDGAWNACAVLDALGEADIDESLLASQHRPEGLLAVSGVVSEDHWTHLLSHHGEEPELRRLCVALGPALGRVGAAYLKDKKRTFTPDPATLQDPEKSTTMLAKTLGWSARLLGLFVPELYVLPDMPATLEIAPLERPAALAGRALGSGLELGELTFLWGRQLPRLRPEFRALAYFRTRPEFTALMTAALGLAGARGVDVKTFDRETKRLHALLKREFKGDELSRLKAAGAKVPAIEVAVRVERLMRAAELTGVRAGLLLAGDVVKAADLIRRFPTEGLTRAEDQLGELFQFAISEGYARLRQRLGVGV
jgi:tetratricopeptide (TPR) repeat protein